MKKPIKKNLTLTLEKYQKQLELNPNDRFARGMVKNTQELLNEIK